MAPGSELVVVAALDRRRAIGRGGGLPWELPDDLRRFKELTTGGVLLMGRRTAQSLGRALPRRRNLVLTRSGAVPYAGMEPVASLEHAVALARGQQALFVIGGAEVYAACLPAASRLHLTHVDTEVVEPDTWFPAVEDAQWRAVSRQEHSPDERHAVGFEHVEYVRSGEGPPG